MHSPCLCTCRSATRDALSGSLHASSRSPHQTGWPRNGQCHTVGPRGQRGGPAAGEGRRKRGAPAPALLSLSPADEPQPSRAQSQVRGPRARRLPEVRRLRGSDPGTESGWRGQGPGGRGGRSPGLSAAVRSRAARDRGRKGGEERAGRGRRCGDTAAGEPARPAPPRPAVQVGAVGGQGSARGLRVLMRGAGCGEAAGGHLWPWALWQVLGPRGSLRTPRDAKLEAHRVCQILFLFFFFFF